MPIGIGMETSHPNTKAEYLKETVYAMYSEYNDFLRRMSPLGSLMTLKEVLEAPSSVDEFYWYDRYKFNSKFLDFTKPMDMYTIRIKSPALRESTLEVEEGNTIAVKAPGQYEFLVSYKNYCKTWYCYRKPVRSDYGI